MVGFSSGGYELWNRFRCAVAGLGWYLCRFVCVRLTGAQAT